MERTHFFFNVTPCALRPCNSIFFVAVNWKLVQFDRQTVANRPPDHGSSQTCRSTIGGTSFLPPPTFVPSSPIILIFTSKYLHRDRHLAANKSCRYIRL